PPFVLITSALHMKRSENVFTKAGFSFISYPCDYKVYPLENNFENILVPRIELLNEWSYFIKEMVGLAVYKLTGKA
ncbi:MAG: YdcF family protein, partial [Bacteroidota bacterium]|nr:YdcF family protein [Bacteroidota bacterium]